MDDVRPARGSALSTVLQRAILLGAALAMLLFALPLAVVVQGLYREEAANRVARDAETARGVLREPELRALRNGRPEALADVILEPHSGRVELGVYDADGRKVFGTGPATGEDVVVDAARTLVEAEQVTSERIVVAVPVPDDDGRRPFVVRAAEDDHEYREHTYVAWVMMAGIGLVVLLVVAAVGRSRARRIARPLQSLARAADALGHGDFSVRASRAGIAEVDDVSANLERTARRIGGIIERERAFSSDASHQLRTPLTAVRLGLEAALITPGADVRQAAADALVGLDRLEQTVLDLLALARDTGGLRTPTDVVAVVTDVAQAWRPRLAAIGREVRVDAGRGGVRAAFSEPAIRTVLDVLVDNAMVHGAGEVRVGVRMLDDAVLVEVSDEGPGVTGDLRRIFVRRSADAKGTGIGLSLARSLVEADGGRLELVRAVPATFAVLLPGLPDDGPDAGQAAGPTAGQDAHDGPRTTEDDPRTARPAPQPPARPRATTGAPRVSGSATPARGYEDPTAGGS